MRFYRAVLPSASPSAFFDLVLTPFRSWVLCILVVSGLTLYLKGQSRHLSPRGGIVGAQIDEVKPLPSRM